MKRERPKTQRRAAARRAAPRAIRDVRTGGPTVGATPDFDPAATRASLDMVRRTVGRYFRLEVHDGDNLPAGRCMVVGCHSGVVPYDAACALLAIEQATGRLARSVGHTLWAGSQVVERYLRQRGAIIGNRRESTALLAQGDILLVMPGGAADMTRPIWRDAYRVLPHKGFAPGRGGYIKVALSTRAPIVPMAIVGAEEAHAMLYDVQWLAKLFGAPFFPLVAFPLPLPVKIYVRFGRPIRFRRPPAAAANQAVVDRLNAQVRHRLQALIDDTVRRRHGIIWSRYDASSGG